MRKIFGIIIMIFGIVVSILFGISMAWMTLEGIHYGYIEYDVLTKILCIFIFGLVITVIGVYFIQPPKRKKEKPKNKEEYKVDIDGHIYYKIGGSFCVQHPLAVRLVTLFTAIFWCFLTIFMFTMFEKNNVEFDIFICLGYILLIVFFSFVSYFTYRPKVEVRENTIIYFPRFKKKIIIDFSKITYRYVEDANFHFFTIFSSNRPRVYRITYYNEFKELFSVNTNIQNAIRFDINVVHHMVENGYLKDDTKNEDE